MLASDNLNRLTVGIELALFEARIGFFQVIEIVARAPVDEDNGEDDQGNAGGASQTGDHDQIRV